jgi:hypothetical protein
LSPLPSRTVIVPRSKSSPYKPQGATGYDSITRFLGELVKNMMYP